MKDRLEEERKQLLHELAQAQMPEYGRSEEENVTEMEDYQSVMATTNAAKERLNEVEEALQRIQDTTYGVTEDGKEIPEERLRANPAAKTLIV
ncbi:MAG TPA: hypothetical protein VLG69_00285 [Candidatus Andersenbacteria bacterium]|nr:hypothetical protein [Candidatus Andersenbacteria bacterium]